MYLNKEFLIGVVVFLFVFITRISLVEQFNSHWDGAQFSMAVVSFDLFQDRPSPPGYPLYIFSGKIINYFIHEPHLSLLIVNALASSLGVVILYYVGKNIFNRKVGILSSLIFFTGPVFYYFGVAAYGYGLVPFSSVLFAYSIYRAFIDKKNNWLSSAILFALAVGIRPQELVSYLPLFILGLFSLPGKEKLYYLLSAIIGTFIWIFPMIADAGSIEKFIHINLPQPNSALFKNTPNKIELARRIIQGIYLTQGFAILGLLFYPFRLIAKTKSFRKVDNRKIVFFSIWIMPSLLFNIFVRSDHAGHQQVYLSALVLLSSYAIIEIFKNFRYLLYIFIAILIIFNLWNFFRDRDPNYQKTYTQTSFHYTDLRKNDVTYLIKTSFIKDKFKPFDTIIFAMSPMWRVTMYYLPSYKLFNIDALETKDESFVNNFRTGMNWQKTEVINKKRIFVVPYGIRNIVFFDSAYCNYDIKNLKKINFSQNNCIGILSVHDKQVYKYSYKSFEEIK